MTADRHATDHLDGAIRDGRHVMSVRVYYEDTDLFLWPPIRQSIKK